MRYRPSHPPAGRQNRRGAGLWAPLGSGWAGCHGLGCACWAAHRRPPPALDYPAEVHPVSAARRRRRSVDYHLPHGGNPRLDWRGGWHRWPAGFLVNAGRAAVIQRCCITPCGMARHGGRPDVWYSYPPTRPPAPTPRRRSTASRAESGPARTIDRCVSTTRAWPRNWPRPTPPRAASRCPTAWTGRRLLSALSAQPGPGWPF
jgi:hypothetical protein